MKTQDLFKHPFLNKLTRTNSILVIRIYTLISASVFSYGVFSVDISLFRAILCLVLGLLLFTLVEYLIHRFVYHSGEDYLDDKNWQYKAHGVHHSFPREKDLLAMPLPLALVASGILFLLFYALMSSLVFFFFPGFLLGYAGYLFIHYKVHTRKPPKNLLRYLWIHHHIHHHIQDDKAFGVSSPLWDFVFGTMPSYKDQAQG
jgi:sterol desaturase/sphingolipid hydroxylase (fatty acid hydroxylase superfamily)